jgi:hypothetical protein
VVAFGHIHLPMTTRQDGVRIVNPGAIASPNYTTRQSVRTVALLYVMADRRVEVVHVDLAAPERPFDPAIDWAAGFRANAGRFSDAILDPALEPLQVRRREVAGMPDGDRALAAYLRLAHRCWAGELERITPELLLAELPAELRSRVAALIGA